MAPAVPSGAGAKMGKSQQPDISGHMASSQGNSLILRVAPGGCCGQRQAPWTACTAWTRCAADVPAVQDAVTTGDDAKELPPWLALRPMTVATDAKSKSSTAPITSPLTLAEPDELLKASVQELILKALSLAYGGGKEAQWFSVMQRLEQVELSPEEAFLVFHSMVKLGAWNHDLLQRRGTFEPDEDCSFQSLVNHLPLSHKIQLILIHSGHVSRGDFDEVQKLEEPPDPKRAWMTVDPVDMEAWERDRFFKGRIKVLRFPKVTAKVSRTAPGKRLRATLASQLFQVSCRRQ
eukprot:symbB.v1.2.002897.t1/scaffold156.1/size293155/9